ncbi:TPA: TrbI/VirB10 family protein [Escherichia coli]|nr:TrbI/VirB10 family protein [Escherichia coli]HDI8888034.1 TrbI/VirB10 family protein [Escherichia coli]
MTDMKKTDDLVDDANQSKLESKPVHDIGDIRNKNNRMRSGFLFGLMAVLVIGIFALKTYKNYFADDQQKASESTGDTSISQVSKIRTGLGQNFDPVENKAIINPGATGSGNTVSDGHKEVPQEGFRKYLSIPVAGQGGSQTGASGSSRTSQTSEPQEERKESKENVPGKSGMKVTAINLDPDLYIEENRLIPCALTTRFVSDVAGRISCVFTEDVWSANHHTKLLEQGTKAFGRYQTGTLNHGQGRMFVMWEQLRTPDNKRIDMVNTAAAGPLGEAGIDGWIDSHFWERFGGSLMLSMVQDVAAAAADNAPGKDRNVDYTENSRQAMAEMAKVALENSINTPPTMYKNQGDIITIMVGEDIDFSDIYELKVK